MIPFGLSMFTLLETAKVWFLLIIFILEESSVAVVAVDPKYAACVPRTCGNLNVSYPFFIQGVQESFCGFPDFGINCSNSASPMIKVSENYYVIDDIYPNQTLRVRTSVVLSAINCTLPQIGNITEETPLTVVEEGSSLLRLLSNCTGSISVLQKYVRYPCNSSDGKSWGMAMYEDDQNLNVTLEKCATNVLVPFEKGDERDENNTVVEDYEGLLARGFLFNFNWSAIDCVVCLESGGKCGFSMETIPYQFRCYCPDRPHRESCKPRKSFNFPF